MTPYLILTAILAVYVAWNLGANDVANSMGTSVGSRALSLSQALVVAGILEFTGAVLFSHRVAATLATEVVDPSLFTDSPQVLLLGMIAVLISSGLWLQIATSLGLPVASSHAVVGAIAGFGIVAVGTSAINWATIGRISLAWVITPFISGLVAAGFYRQVQRWILAQPHPLEQLREWIPWLSALLLSLFSVIAIADVVEHLQQNWSLALPIPTHDVTILVGAVSAIGLTFVNWQQLEGVKASIKAKYDQKKELKFLEKQMGGFQVLSACFVAFAHGANDVGNAIAPLVAIAYITKTGFVPLTSLQVPLWILILGGLGIVAGLAVQGKKVITTVGEGIIPLQPSSGFCAEIATATTVLLASRLGLPVSTSHALVGAVVGIGLSQQTQVRFETVKSVILAWVVTLPVTAGLGAICFMLLHFIFIV